MMDINWKYISPEDFEELCVSLLYREGYKNILPLGSRGVKEDGKDAIELLFSAQSKDSKMIVFQFKRWTADYKDGALKLLIKKELDDKIVPSGQKIDEYILVTCHPLSTLKEWFLDELSQNYKFHIHFFEKSWLENRLNSDSQDIRRRYWGIDIERHSFKSLKAICQKQVQNALSTIKHKYIPELYVNREVEKEFYKFLDSDKSCFVLVDRSGRGKTNLLCHLAKSRSKKSPVIFIFGNKNLATEEDLITQIITELGYAGPKGTRWQADMDDLDRLLAASGSNCLIIIDGISENSNIVLMKNAISALLNRYGNKSYFKFCLSCRDILWPRFAADLFSNQFKEYMYLTNFQRSQKQQLNTSVVNVGISLGNWSNNELELAIKHYTAYYDVQFSLATDAKNQCKYPLLFGLFCETYANQSLGLITALPFYQVFEDYLKAKINRIADYLHLNFPPDEIFLFLWKIRETMWMNDDSDDIKKDELLKMFRDENIDKPYEVLDRMLDEGLFIKTGYEDNVFIRFGFDELADYVLYLVFMKDAYKNRLGIQDIIQNQVKLLEDEVQKIKAEKFLVLIARSLDNEDDLNFLLDKTLEKDLFIFGQCCWQKVLLEQQSNYSDLDILDNFAQKLISYYARIIDRYFLALRDVFTPYSSESDEELGINIKGSPKLREVSYTYRIQSQDPEIKRIKAELVDRFPTWDLSFQSGMKSIRLHNPDGGMVVPYLSSGPWGGPLRTLNFELDSPFPGISIMSPDRLALYDVWQELKNILASYKIRELSTLVQERASDVARKLPVDLIDIRDLDVFDIRLSEILSPLPESREKILLTKDALEFRDYLYRLNNDVFAFKLPKPEFDLSAENDNENWKKYSHDELFKYIVALVSQFIQAYRLLIERNFPEIAPRMNLYNQYPVSCFIIMDKQLDFMKFFLAPVEDIEDADIQIHILPEGQSANIPNGKLTLTGDITFEQYAKQTLKNSKRYKTNSYPIEKTIEIKEFFGNIPLNRFLYKWLLSDLADILQIPFFHDKV